MAPAPIDEHPTYSIAAIPADGIGRKVINAGITVLNQIS
jgi:isocitrate/isopropylmalate dehydrogenase